MACATASSPRQAGAATLAVSLLAILSCRPVQAAGKALVATTAAAEGDGSYFSPRFYMGAAVRRPERRQDGGTCVAGEQHSCAELGDAWAGVCCESDHYCFLDHNWQAACCAVGNDCEGDSSTDNPCPSAMNYCNATVTATVTTTEGSGGGGGEDATSVLTTQSESAGCCPRPCGTDKYHCASSFGGQCCELNAQCASSSQCLIPQTSSSSMTNTVVGIVPSGCSATTQFRCDDNDIDKGCCAIGQTCVAGGGACEGAPALPTDSGSYTVEESSPGLSEPARIGVGVGVALGAALIIGLLTWFCIRRRRTRNQQSTQAGGSNYSSSGIGPGMRQHRSGGPSGRERDILSEVSGDPPTASEGAVVSSAGRSYLQHNGTARDYFGPHAVSGPYTENPNTPREDLGQPERGVPIVPQSPGDIAVPVEIDSQIGNRGITAGSPGQREQHDAQDDRRVRLEGAAASGGQEGEAEGPFELAGSPMPSPSPLSPGDELSIAPRDGDHGNPTSMAERAALSPSPEPSVALSVSPEPGQRSALERDVSQRSRAG